MKPTASHPDIILLAVAVITSFALGGSAGVVTGDLNGDGHLEILSTARSGAGITVFPASGARIYETSTTILVEKRIGEMRLADVDGDSHLDLIVTLPEESTAQVWQGNGDGTFSEGQTIDVGDVPLAMDFFDFDGDAVPDLLVGTEGNRLVVYGGSATGSFQELVTVESAASPELLLGLDTDADGWNDILYGASGAEALKVMRNNIFLRPPAITSLHHPNPQYAYIDNSAFFTFDEVAYAGYYYVVFDQEPSTFPEATSWEPASTGGEYMRPDLSDGTWYLHAISALDQSRFGNLAQHSKITIDTTLVSETHPNQDEWTSADAFSVAWLTDLAADPNVTYRWTVDHSEGTLPGSESETTNETSVTVSPADDGVNHFHLTSLRPDGSGSDTALHYTFRVDTTPPAAITEGSIAVLDPERHPQLSWQAPEDAGSGISHYRIYGRQGSPLTSRRDLNQYTILAEHHTGITYTHGSAEAAPGFHWYYAVIPVDRVGNTQWESFLTLSTAPGSTPTPTPTPSITPSPTPSFTPTSTEGPSPTPTATPTPVMAMSVATDLHGSPGESIDVPIHLTNAQQVYSISFSLQFEEQILSLSDVSGIGPLNGELISYGNVVNGNVEIGAALTSALDGVSADIFNVQFEIKSDASPGGTSALVLSGVTINEQPASIRFQDGLFTVGGTAATPTPSSTPTQDAVLVEDFNDPGLGFVMVGGTENGSTVSSGVWIPVSDPDFSDGVGLRVDAVEGDTVQIYMNPITAAGLNLISVNAVSEQAGVGMSLAVLDGSAFAGEQNLAYFLGQGSEVLALEFQSLPILYDVPSGLFYPVLQTVGPGTVYFDNLSVVATDPVLPEPPDGVEVNLVDSPLFGGSGARIYGDLRDGASGFVTNLNNDSAHNDPIETSANHFETVGAPGCISLLARSIDRSLSNITCEIDVEGPVTIHLVCYAQSVFGASGFLALVVSAMGTDPVHDLSTFGVLVDQAQLAGGWTLVQTYGPIRDGTFGVLLTAQAALGDVAINLDDFAVYVVQEPLESFDAVLLGQ